MEVEFITCLAVIQETIWLRRFLLTLGIIPKASKPITFHCDSQAIITYVKDPKYHGKTKHINMKNNFVKNIIAQKQITL